MGIIRAAVLDAVGHFMDDFFFIERSVVVNITGKAAHTKRLLMLLLLDQGRIFRFKFFAAR